MVYELVLKTADHDLRLKVITLFEEAKEILKKVKMDLAGQEENFVRQLLAKCAIPYPRLLVKYHKTINKKE